MLQNIFKIYFWLKSGMTVDSCRRSLAVLIRKVEHDLFEVGHDNL